MKTAREMIRFIGASLVSIVVCLCNHVKVSKQALLFEELGYKCIQYDEYSIQYEKDCDGEYKYIEFCSCGPTKTKYYNGYFDTTMDDFKAIQQQLKELRWI